MNRFEKNSAIETLKKDFQSNDAAFLVGMQGMTVAQIESLRNGIRHQGASMKVAKNSLLRLATEDMPALAPMHSFFRDQIAVIFVPKDASGIAKFICNTAENTAQLKIVAGCYESRVINQDMVKFLGSLPSKEIMLAQLCGLMKAPIARQVSVQNQLIARLLWVMKQAAEKQG